MRKLVWILPVVMMAWACSDDLPVQNLGGADAVNPKLRIEATVGQDLTKSNAEGMVTDGHPWIDGD